MSETRRTSAPRKRPQAGLLQVPAHGDDTAASTAGEVAEDDGLEAQRRQLMSELEGALREQPGMDPDGVEFMLGHVRAALDEVTPDQVAAPDRCAWMQALDAFVGQAALSEEDRAALVRQLDAAIDPLQGADASIATEFARRLQADGEQQALRWLKEQQASARQEQDQADSAAADTVAAPGAETITRSRSRRLRGPPQ
jgi:hypothetical protein